MGPDTAQLVAAILNAAWLVRHYARGARVHSGPMRARRDGAVKDLGLAVRHAFNSSEDFEALLAALADGLNPKDDTPRF